MQFTFSIFCIYIITEILEKVKFLWVEYVEVLRCCVCARSVLSGQGLVPVLTSTPGRSVNTTSTYDS